MRWKELRLNDVLSTHIMDLESIETFEKTREVRIIRCFEEHKHTGNEGEVNLEVGGVKFRIFKFTYNVQF